MIESNPDEDKYLTREVEFQAESQHSHCLVRYGDLLSMGDAVFVLRKRAPLL